MGVMDGAGLGADGLGTWLLKGAAGGGGGAGRAAGGIASPWVRGGVGDNGCRSSSAAKLSGASNKPQAIRPKEQEAR